MPKHSLKARIMVWRLKYIGQKNFILILSVFVGFGGGLIALALKTLVYYLHKFLLEKIHFHFSSLMLLILPTIGILLAYLFKKFVIKDFVKHNIMSILYAKLKNESKMKAHKIFSSIIGATFTAGFGGSIGLESPAISSGGALGSNLSKYFRLNYKTTTLLLACGAAGAIAAIFNTPITAIVFALEVLILDLTRFSLIPLLISSVSGAIVNNIFFQDSIAFHFKSSDTFSFEYIPLYLILGIVAGIVSVYFTRIFLYIESVFEGIKGRFRRVYIGGIILGVLLFVFPPLYGEGYEVVKAIFSKNMDSVLKSSFFYDYRANIFIFISFFVMLIVMKAIATSVTIGAGGVGGIFAPSVFSGAITGYLFAFTHNTIINPNSKISEINFALVGMAGVLGGVLQAPLTGVFLIAEMTRGYDLIVPLMLTTTIAFLTVKYFTPHSIITTQLAQKGHLVTHHKDKAVLTYIDLKKVIEHNFTEIHVNDTLGDLVKSIAKSKRNIFPVLDDENKLKGVVLLDEVREIMFNKELYESVFVRDLMTAALSPINIKDTMEDVANKFNETGAWNLAVVDDGKYLGFISKSNLFSVYRKQLIELTDE